MSKKKAQPKSAKPASASERSGNKNLRRSNAGNFLPKERKAGNSVDMAKFATELALRHSLRAAAKKCKISTNTCYAMMRRPEWPAAFDHALEEVAKQVRQDAIETYKLEVEFVDNLVARKLATHQTHERLGDLDFYKGAEVSYKRLGLIQSTRIVAHGGNASAAAVAALDVYRSQWFLERQERMKQQLEQQEQLKLNGPPPTTSPA